MRKFRVVSYENGYGKIFWRIQHKFWWLPAWITIRTSIVYDSSEILEYDNEGDVITEMKSRINALLTDERRRVKL